MMTAGAFIIGAWCAVCLVVMGLLLYAMGAGYECEDERGEEGEL